MDQDANDFIENIDSTSQSLMEYTHRGITCLLDLPNEILLQIFRYLSLPSIFHSFSTSSQPELRPHRLIHAYYNKMKLDGIINNDYNDLANLFSDSNISFRPQSLILNNKNVNCIIQRFLAYTDINIIKSIFAHLRYLTLIDCSSSDLRRIQRYNVDMTLMEYLHIVIRTIDEDLDFLLDDSCDATINQFLFGTQISSLHEVIIHTPDGLMLPPQNYALFIVLFLDFTIVGVDISWMISLHYTGSSPFKSFIFCEIWRFVDFPVWAICQILVSWISFERHILIFHNRLLVGKWRMIYLHYAPPIILIVYSDWTTRALEYCNFICYPNPLLLPFVYLISLPEVWTNIHKIIYRLKNRRIAPLPHIG
ncbi:unnamed protein product [Adineta steineri]|uniref:F-box domain-containing protein n=1 Tax=Adineta steineri TaxID=433720 RepID=A0A815IB49_9BILA|nr:unnamed protein product [Adineta steineri]